MATRRLSAIAAGVPEVAEVRGLGLMIGIELAEPDGGRARPDLAADVIAAAEQDGVLLMRSGADANVIRFLPPLNLADWELDLALGVLGRALLDTAGRASEAHTGVARRSGRPPRRRRSGLGRRLGEVAAAAPEPQSGARERVLAASLRALSHA
jgi:hypothetical protein